MNNAPVHCPDVCSRAISEHVIIEVVYILIHILINPYYISFYSQVAKCFFHTRCDHLTFPLPQPIVSLPAEHSKSGQRTLPAQESSPFLTFLVTILLSP